MDGKQLAAAIDITIEALLRRGATDDEIRDAMRELLPKETT
jgi:hypothetical protein